MTTVICIPTYQEVDGIAAILGRTLTAVPDADILVIDDSSPDGTAGVVQRIARVDRRVHLLMRPGKQGLGAAYRAGFDWALDRGYEQVVEMDADGSHRPEQLPDLLAALAGADVALGSRWIPGGRTEGWPLRRRLISRAGSLYSRLLLRLPQRDITGGFRAYRASALRAIRHHEVRSDGYSLQIEMLWRAVLARSSVVEVPIVFAERLTGTSKMSLGIVIEAIRRVTVWGLTARVGVRDRESRLQHV
ncbi:MAG: polyprenol monophosphomannose synthase [Pseudolysinimonas sp.]